MTLGLQNEEVRKDYNEEYLDYYFNEYAAQINKALKENEGQLNGLDEVAKSRLSASIRHSMDKKGVYLSYTEFEDEIEVFDSTIKAVDDYPIKVRVYRPKSLNKTVQQEGNAVYVNFHGGGWLFGDLGSDASQLYWLVHLSGVTVIDVDYRMVPEWEFKTCFYDGYSVIAYLNTEEGSKEFGIDANKISVGGTSAGGKMALSVALFARDFGKPVNLVLSNVPVVEDFGTVKEFSDLVGCESAKRYFDDPALTFEIMIWFGEYCNKGDREGQKIIDKYGLFKDLTNLDKYHLNLLADDINLKDLPTTHLITVGFTDILRDGGKEYAKKLIDNNINCEIKFQYGFGHNHNKFTNKFKTSRNYLYLLSSYLKRLNNGEF